MAVPLTLSSVPAQTPYVQYVATASQTVFPYPFEITQDSDLVCLINGVAQPTDGGYTLTGQGATGGGNLTFTLGQTVGAIITLYRNITIARITQLSQNGTFFSANFNDEFNRIYLIMQQLQQSLLPGGNQAYALMIPNSNNPAPTTLLTPSNYANKYLSFDTNGNPVPALLTSSGSITAALIASLLYPTQASGPLTQGVIGGIFQPITPAETTAGVMPVNYFYPPGCVDRYATNTVPGTTDMTAAWNAAVATAMVQGGEVTYGYTKLYSVTAPVNATFAGAGGVPGIVIRSIGLATHDNTAGIVAKHTGVAVFDCTGNDAITFRDVSIHTDAATFPKTGILTARNSFNGSLIIRLDNVRIAGKFSVACYYNYGSEDDVLVGCYFANSSTAANTRTRVYTANNISGLTSPFVTIATGNQSCIDHNVFGCQDWNSGGGSNSDCVYLEQVDSYKSYGGWGNTASAGANGRALIYVDMTNAASNFCTIDGLTAENTGSFNQAYAVAFSNNAFTPTGWSMSNIRGISATNAITAGALVTCDNFNIRNVSELVSNGLVFSGTLQNSVIESPSTKLTIGTSKQNLLVGDSSSWTVTTRTHDNWVETGTTNTTFAPGIVTATNGWTAVGAITQRGKFEYSGKRVIFSIVMSAATSIAWTANATIPTLPGVATDSFTCSVTDYTLGTLIGRGDITAGSGASTITIPVAQTTTAHTIVIDGSYFVA